MVNSLQEMVLCKPVPSIIECLGGLPLKEIPKDCRENTLQALLTLSITQRLSGSRITSKLAQLMLGDEVNAWVPPSSFMHSSGILPDICKAFLVHTPGVNIQGNGNGKQRMFLLFAASILRYSYPLRHLAEREVFAER